MSVTAIRRVGRAQALEQVRLDPTLATTSFSILAKRWGVSRTTARNWLRDGVHTELPAVVTPAALPPVVSPLAPVAVVPEPMPAGGPKAVPAVAEFGHGFANFTAYIAAG